MAHRYKIRVIVIVALFVLLYYHNSMGQIGSGVTACTLSGPVSCREYLVFHPYNYPERIPSKIELNQNGGLEVVYIFVGRKGGDSITSCEGGISFYCNGQFSGHWELYGVHVTPELAQDLMNLSPCFNCEISINASPSEVWPQKTGNDDKTTATIMVTSTNPPPEGCTVNFKVEPVTTIGHEHDGNRPKGTVTPATITIPGGSSGAASAEYKSSEVAGEEKIIAEIKGEKKGETTIQVKVPNLFDLGVGGSYRLTGGKGTHPANHYGTDSAIVSTNYMANDFYEQFSATLGINDMSLPWGGLFDINGDWSTPHDWHRKGTSIDFSKYYKDSGGNNIEVIFYDEDGNVIKTTDLITDDDLDKYFAEKKYKCTRQEKKIGKIHYECPK